MADLTETAINHMSGDNFCTVYTCERKYVQKLRKFAKDYPDSVKIKMRDNNGIEAEVPASWFKFVQPPRSWKLTDEQRQAASERMRKAREAKNKKESESEDK